VEMPPQNRARFAWPPERVCGTADGQPVRPGQLTRRMMNFDQHWRTEGIEEVDYSIRLPLAFLREMMEREQADYMADSLQHPDLDDEYENARRERGWPSVPEMLEDPELLRMSVEFYTAELLTWWLGDNGPPAKKPGYVLNTVRFAGRDGDCILLTGRARRADQPVRYQDA
jgi:hypothetical protein